MKPPVKVALTCGDRNGVGFEVAAKALVELKKKFRLSPRAVFFLFRHRSLEKKQAHYFALLDQQFKRKTFFSLQEALADFNLDPHKNSRYLYDLSLSSNEALWVREAALACKRKMLDSLVTGPLSKSTSAQLPRKPLGHTGIFRQLFPKKTFLMAFIGKDFNVLLATDHIPFSKVEAALKKINWPDVLSLASGLKKQLQSRKKIALLGLNPHAGEGGLLGKTEKLLLPRLPKDFDGPLVPDAAFLKKNWAKYSLFVCLYHDQGLIPFKMHHGQDSGVHVTLGLPFIRTSVDHGTAFDLFNKNLANASSMKDAILLNLKMLGV